ncbi:Hypothetical Protein RSKD131_4311 [Cereibacter sphaeroides KD131]|nr:Hypothetical Protein RSKD131_4311 [Cereibacter sphaeroides KD131]
MGCRVVHLVTPEASSGRSGRGGWHRARCAPGQRVSGSLPGGAAASPPAGEWWAAKSGGSAEGRAPGRGAVPPRCGRVTPGADRGAAKS